MEIVKFKNGKYGIRKRTLIQKVFNKEGVFRDFKPYLIYWRSSDNSYFKDCQLDSFEEAVEKFNNINFGVVDKVLHSRF
jgi:hypothetical protein